MTFVDKTCDIQPIQRPVTKHDVHETLESQENPVKNENNSNINGQNSRTKLPKGTFAVVGDSIIFGVRGVLLTTNKHKVMVRFLIGWTVEDITDTVNPILKRELDFIILHVGTNKTVSMTS